MTRHNLDPFPSPRAFVQTGESPLPELDRWQQIGPEKIEIATGMTRRNELSGGTPSVREFEEQWRRRTNTKCAITVMNGTSSLYSAYFRVGVGPGDEVLCPVNTWICSIPPVPLLGARPVFCDIDPEPLQLETSTSSSAPVSSARSSASKASTW